MSSVRAQLLTSSPTGGSCESQMHTSSSAAAVSASIRRVPSLGQQAATAVRSERPQKSAQPGRKTPHAGPVGPPGANANSLQHPPPSICPAPPPTAGSTLLRGDASVAVSAIVITRSAPSQRRVKAGAVSANLSENQVAMGAATAAAKMTVAAAAGEPASAAASLSRDTGMPAPTARSPCTRTTATFMADAATFSAQMSSTAIDLIRESERTGSDARGGPASADLAAAASPSSFPSAAPHHSSAAASLQLAANHLKLAHFCETSAVQEVSQLLTQRPESIHFCRMALETLRRNAEEHRKLAAYHERMAQQAGAAAVTSSLNISVDLSTQVPCALAPARLRAAPSPIEQAAPHQSEEKSQGLVEVQPDHATSTQSDNAVNAFEPQRHASLSISSITNAAAGADISPELSPMDSSEPEPTHDFPATVACASAPVATKTPSSSTLHAASSPLSSCAPEVQQDTESVEIVSEVSDPLRQRSVNCGAAANLPALPLSRLDEESADSAAGEDPSSESMNVGSERQADTSQQCQFGHVAAPLCSDQAARASVNHDSHLDGPTPMEIDDDSASALLMASPSPSSAAAAAAAVTAVALASPVHVDSAVPEPARAEATELKQEEEPTANLASELQLPSQKSRQAYDIDPSESQVRESPPATTGSDDGRPCKRSRRYGPPATAAHAVAPMDLRRSHKKQPRIGSRSNSPATELASPATSSPAAAAASCPTLKPALRSRGSPPAWTGWVPPELSSERRVDQKARRKREKEIEEKEKNKIKSSGP